MRYTINKIQGHETLTTRSLRRDEETRRTDETPTRDAINEKPTTRRQTRREDEKARYILKTDQWPRKRLSTFSTMT